MDIREVSLWSFQDAHRLRISGRRLTVHRHLRRILDGEEELPSRIVDGHGLRAMRHFQLAQRLRISSSLVPKHDNRVPGVIFYGVDVSAAWVNPNATDRKR